MGAATIMARANAGQAIRDVKIDLIVQSLTLAGTYFQRYGYRYAVVDVASDAGRF